MINFEHYDLKLIKKKKKKKVCLFRLDLTEN